MTILRSLVLLVFIVSLAANQSALAFQDANEDFRFRIAPEQCMSFVSWSGLGKLNPNGNPTEKWLAQDEIQLTFKKLFSAIREYQELHPIKEEAVNELLMKVPAVVKDCPASLYIGNFDPKLGLEESAFGGAVVKLNEHEQWAAEMMKKLVESNRDQGFEERTIEGNRFYVKRMEGEESEFNIGIMKGHLVMTFGRDALENAMENLKTPPPAWIDDVREETAVDRTLGFFHFDPAVMIEFNKTADPGERIPEFLHVDDIQSVSGAIGLDNEGFIASVFLRCPEKSQGLLSVFDFNAIDEAFISEIPDGQMATSAARFSLPNVLELVNSVSELLRDATFSEMIGEVELLTNMDFEQEILDSFEGSISSYQSLSPLTMTSAGVISLKVKDRGVFSKRLAKFNKEIAGEIKALELGEFVEKESQGQKIYSFKRPIYAGPSFSWCHVDDYLYVSVDDKSLSTHLRKRGRTKNRLIDDPRFKNSFDYGESRGWGKPVAFSHIDVTTIMELIVPVAQTFLAGQAIPDFDFTVDDIPSVDVLTHGVEANMIVVFRGKDGFHMIERSTLPAGSMMSTGVAIGMLLPAVQQVRNAARRAATMNNMRQLQLAILNYESAHKELPPAYSTDEHGKPLLSWRVHILPFLEETKLYEQFHLDEPWDSPHNKTLIAKMPQYFENPSAVVDEGQTTFLGAGGKNGVFSGDTGIHFRDVTDGTSNTISILDVNSDNAVTWTAPEDFNPDEVKDIVAATKGNWPGGQVIVTFVDGSCHALNGYSEEELRQMMSRNDGKVVELNDR